VADVDRVLLVGKENPQGDVGVEEQRGPGIHWGPALAWHVLRLVVPLGQAPSFGSVHRLGPPVLGLAQPLGMWGPQMVGDGVRPLEALLGEALLEGQRAALQRELDVVLPGDGAKGDPLDHRRSLLDSPRRLLVPLDALEQRAEVAGAEALVALALDDLVKERAGLPL